MTCVGGEGQARRVSFSQNIDELGYDGMCSTVSASEASLTAAPWL